jgi:DNA-directed RNA polymerase subunit K/omega
MTGLNLVEEYPKDAELTQFEKVLVAARRAKDLHKGSKMPLLDT